MTSVGSRCTLLMLNLNCYDFTVKNAALPFESCIFLGYFDLSKNELFGTTAKGISVIHISTSQLSNRI